MSHTCSAVLLVIAAISFAGCSGQPAGLPETPPPTPEVHAHPSEGPHHGHLIELGAEEYHGELLHDDAAGTVTIYILDKLATTEVAVPQDAVTLNLMVNGAPQQFPMTAMNPVDSKASHFQIVNKEALEALENGETKGRLNVTIEGKPYIGVIEHHEHEDDHKH